MTERRLLNVRGLTGWRLAIGLYVVGYVVYLARAMMWGAQQGADPYLGFVLWHALLYGPLWPLVLISVVTQMVIATV